MSVQETYEEKLLRENKELRTRVAELESLNKFNEKIILYGDETTMLREQTKKIEELQNRLSTLEKEKKEANNIIQAKHDYCSSLCCDIANLQDRLSTLLKASEGLEKALEKLLHDLERVDHHQVSEELWRIEKVIADFRALKEMK